MSERWKYQIKSGLVFGITLAFAISVFKGIEDGFVNEYFTWKFLFKLLIFIAIGIFGIGYFNWKAKVKKEDLEK